MRFVTSLACATLVVRATVVEEDDDLQFVRALSSNGTNATTTATPTATTDPNATTPQAATTTDPNATTTLAPTTTAAAGNVTTTAAANNTATANVTEAPVTEAPASGVVTSAPADANAISGMLANVSNGTNTTATELVQIEVKSTAKDPFYCAVSGETTGSCAATTAAPAGNATTAAPGGGRMLASHAADLKAAHNTFCGAFSFSGAHAMCSGLGDANLVKLFTPSVTGTATAAQVKTAMNGCVTGMSLASKMGATDCYQAAGAATVGACFGNGAAVSAAANPGAPRTIPGVKACTTSTGTNAASMVFKTTTDMSLPTWRSDVTINKDTVKAAAQTAAGSTGAADVLSNALVMAAVEISTKQTSALSTAGLDMAAELGMSAAQFSAVQTAVNNAGGLAAINPSEVAAPTAGSALATAVTAASAAVKSSYAPTVTVTGSGGGSTSAATGMMVGVSAMAGFLSLIF